MCQGRLVSADFPKNSEVNLKINSNSINVSAKVINKPKRGLRQLILTIVLNVYEKAALSTFGDEIEITKHRFERWTASEFFPYGF